MTHQPAQNTLGQAWRIGLTGMISLSAAMGIGRFAFTPLLPMMLHDHTINLVNGSWLATSNYLGYFLGAMLCACWRGLPAVTTIRSGLIATVLLTLGMGLLHGQAIWLLLRLLSGIASALVFVYSAGWCLQRLTQLQRPDMGGIIFAGPGVGILLTGLSSSVMVAGAWHASTSWIAFSLLALLLTAVVWRTFSDNGKSPAAPAVNKKESRTIPAASAEGVTEPAAIRKEIRWQVLAYGISGFGYIITATFLPVIARQALPGSSWPDFFWPLFGFCIALGAMSATRIPVHLDQRLLLAGSYVTQAVGIISSILLPNAFGFALGSVLLGLPFTAITLFAMREARRLRSNNTAGLMGLMTASYGIGQIAGPPLATWLQHSTGSFTPSLSIAAATLLSGAALYIWLATRDVTSSHSATP